MASRLFILRQSLFLSALFGPNPPSPRWLLKIRSCPKHTEKRREFALISIPDKSAVERGAETRVTKPFGEGP